MKKSLPMRGLEDRLARASAGVGDKRPKSIIPVPKGRSSSLGRDSRSRLRPVDLSSRKRTSKSQATPTTPAFQQLDVPYGTYSAQSTSSRSGSRCSSADRGFKGHRGKLADTRPIGEKSFQKMAMTRIYEYFQTQPQAIRSVCPPPIARSIMIKSFVDLMAHLLEHFFSNHGVYIKNYVEEIPKLMKKLYYPGNVATSWLKTVNAPHAWPHVMAAMSWLTDLVVQRQFLTMTDFFPAYAPGAGAPSIDPETCLRYSLEAFKAFNVGDDDGMDHIYCQMIEAMKEKQGFTDADLARLEREFAELEADLNDPREKMAIEEFERSNGELQSWNNRIHEAESACERLKCSNEMLQTKLEDSHKHHEQCVQEEKYKSEEVETLTETVRIQPMTVDEASVLVDKVSQLQRELQNNEAYLLQLEKINCSYDMKLAAVKAKLNQMCVDYNKEILESSEDLHEFTISTDLNFHEKDLDRALEEMGDIGDGLAQFHERYKARLKLKDDSSWEYEQRIQEKEEQHKKHREEMEELVTEGRRLTTEHSALETRYKKMASDYNREHEAVRAETRRLVGTMPDVEEKKVRSEQLEVRNAAETVALQELVVSILAYFDDLFKVAIESKECILAMCEED